MWEHAPMERLAADGQVMAYRHHSFWQRMDSQRDKDVPQRLWDTNKAPWRRQELWRQQK
jgi:glucose-1-phosphate cytidylyltransferase